MENDQQRVGKNKKPKENWKEGTNLPEYWEIKSEPSVSNAKKVFTNYQKTKNGKELGERRWLTPSRFEIEMRIHCTRLDLNGNFHQSGMHDFYLMQMGSEIVLAFMEEDEWTKSGKDKPDGLPRFSTWLSLLWPDKLKFCAKSNFWGGNLFSQAWVFPTSAEAWIRGPSPVIMGSMQNDILFPTLIYEVHMKMCLVTLRQAIYNTASRINFQNMDDIRKVSVRITNLKFPILNFSPC